MWGVAPHPTRRGQGETAVSPRPLSAPLSVIVGSALPAPRRGHSLCSTPTSSRPVPRTIFASGNGRVKIYYNISVRYTFGHHFPPPPFLYGGVKFSIRIFKSELWALRASRSVPRLRRPSVAARLGGLARCGRCAANRARSPHPHGIFSVLVCRFVPPAAASHGCPSLLTRLCGAPAHPFPFQRCLWPRPFLPCSAGVRNLFPLPRPGPSYCR